MRDVEWITDKVLMNVELTKRYNNVKVNKRVYQCIHVCRIKIRILVHYQTMVTINEHT